MRVGRLAARALAQGGVWTALRCGGCDCVSCIGRCPLDHGRQCSIGWRVQALSGTHTPVLERRSKMTKEVRIPGSDHPISITYAGAPVLVSVRDRVIAKFSRALRLDEAKYPPVYYIPRADVDMSLLVRTTHSTYCPYKGDCTYYSIPLCGSRSENAVWSYEDPHDAVAEIKDYLAFYPDRVDEIALMS